MNKLHTIIKESLRDFVQPEELEGVSGWMYHEMAKHIMTHRLKHHGLSFVVGIVVGMLIVSWAAS